MRRIWDHNRDNDYDEAGGVLAEMFNEYEFTVEERFTFLCSVFCSEFEQLMNDKVSNSDVCLLFDNCVKAMHEKVRDDLETRFEFDKVVKEYERG